MSAIVQIADFSNARGTIALEWSVAGVQGRKREMRSL